MSQDAPGRSWASSIAPHWRTPMTVPVMMRNVVYALIPAIVAHAWFFGIGMVVNCLIAAATAVLTEAAALWLRGRPIKPFVLDFSAVVTGILIAMCLPPLTPWWVTVIATFFAIAIAKHAYGGLGFNVFNPAMAGLAVVLISFPEAMSFYTSPDIGDLDYPPPTALVTLHYTLTGTLPDAMQIDALSRATPLDLVKTDLGMMRTMNEIGTSPLFGDLGGRGWEWIANFIALGGFWLLFRNIIRWQAPVAMLGALAAMASLGYIVDAETNAGPAFHVFSGGAMLCAFFIATDPVSGTTTNSGRLIFGAGIGILTYLIRTWGSYPDGIAFAVLLMNMAAPLIDRLTRPRIYGRGAPRRGDDGHDDGHDDGEGPP
ncbi:MAG: RnfABCDGE type electron transport complex subunit D [Gammaproteobacteria bacterium]